MTVQRRSREVLVTGSSVPPEVVARIESRGYTARVIADDHVAEADLHRALDGVSGYLLGGQEQLTAAHVDRASSLEAVAWIGTDFRGNVPGWRRAFEVGVALLSTPGANAVAVAEFTFLLMLTLARPIPPVLTPAVSPEPGCGLRNRTLGIVGAGRIGSHVARAATLGLGMRVVYAARRRNEPLERALGIAQLDLPDLLARSDVVSLHRPAPDAGEPPPVGRPELEAMKDGALLVNTGHPSLVDPTALRWAIETKRIRAAFDGIEPGPAWERLTSLGRDRFLALQQMGYLTREAGLAAGMRAADGVCDVLSGTTSPLVNNPDFPERRRNGRTR